MPSDFSSLLLNFLYQLACPDIPNYIGTWSLTPVIHVVTSGNPNLRQVFGGPTFPVENGSIMGESMEFQWGRLRAWICLYLAQDPFTQWPATLSKSLKRCNLRTSSTGLRSKQRPMNLMITLRHGWMEVFGRTTAMPGVRPDICSPF